MGHDWKMGRTQGTVSIDDYEHITTLYADSRLAGVLSVRSCLDANLSVLDPEHGLPAGA